MSANADVLLDILDGLVPLRLMKLSNPAAAARARDNAEPLSWTIAESGDRLTAPGNFKHPSAHSERAQVLNAMATGLALGALEYGGVTFLDRHWCTAEHPDCPNRSR